jgi:putative endopeptidase
MQYMQKNDWGFDTRDLDIKMRPQDDFYHYANGTWMKKNPIPPNEAAWGSFMKLRYDTDRQLLSLVETLSSKRRARGSAEQMIHDLYCSGLDTKARRTKGLAPLHGLIKRIDAIQTTDDVVTTIAHLERVGSGGVWGVYIDQDMKNSEKYVLTFCQGGLGLPDRDYYLKSDAESLRVRTAYEKHLARLLELAGRRGKASQEAAVVLEIETALAKASMPKEELRDVDKVYHKKAFAQFKKLAPSVPWEEYFRILGTTPKNLIVSQPEFFKAVDHLLSTFPVASWKTYLFTHLVGGFASHLTPELEKENFAFYGTTLTGTKQMKPLPRRVLRVVNGLLGEPLGKIYVAAHFPKDAKRKVTQMVDDLFEAYEARIKGLDWMSSSTKQKAIRKLHQVSRKLGYPDKWKSYRGLVIRPDDYVGNIMRASEFEHRRGLKRLQKPVDRAEWFMSPQTVNAYCSFGLNDIAFPAAILQPPFFSKDADDALNYGGIGTVIGHEITHAFDDQGSKFDGKGNRKTWWTTEDRKRFEAKARVLVKQFNEYTVAGGLKVNGQLTLGENIADLGGASIAFDAYLLRLAKTGREVIHGFTPEQRFFLSFALFERENRRPEAVKVQVLTDPHSPGVYRINGPASNLPEFYEAFSVKKTDKLYREPKNRAKIW